MLPKFTTPRAPAQDTVVHLSAAPLVVGAPEIGRPLIAHCVRRRQRPSKKFIASGETPHGVLSLDNDRARTLRGWRRAIMTLCAEHPRSLRVAWAIEWAISRKGSCHASDSWLVQETGMARNKVQDALRHLEKVGAIIRVHQRNGKRVRRLIYPCNRILLHPSVGSWGNYATPHGGRKTHPTVGSQKKKERKSPLRPSATNPLH